MHKCPECGSASAVKHSHVEDYFFGSGDCRSYYSCSSSTCGVAWPVPAPTLRELEIAYSAYYTHDRRGRSLGDWIRPTVARILYHATSFQSGEICRGPNFVTRLLDDAFCASGGMRPIPHGVVVDVGCGNGERLELFRKIGWNKVWGVEPDAKARATGGEAGRKILEGDATSIPFPENSVDLVMLHHVIEHIAQPTAALSECLRVLRTGTGVLSILTPNFASASSESWGRYWRGLESPRHLRIFTVPALERALKKTGFDIRLATTSARSATWIDSESARAEATARGDKRVNRADTGASYMQQVRRIRDGHNIGDEIVAIAIKR